MQKPKKNVLFLDFCFMCIFSILVQIRLASFIIVLAGRTMHFWLTIVLRFVLLFWVLFLVVIPTDLTLSFRGNSEFSAHGFDQLVLFQSSPKSLNFRFLWPARIVLEATKHR